MRELKRFACIKCGKSFTKMVGGIVFSSREQELMMYPVCNKCKADKIADFFCVKK